MVEGSKQAVLLLMFNRPEQSRLVFDQIRRVKPSRLYISADGPRPDKDGELEKCAQVRSLAGKVDWPCEVKTNFQDENLGCKTAVSKGITWFFSHEEKGIILEDDCLPNDDFFRFCDVMLERYKSENRVWMITGNNFQKGNIRSKGSYYFSKYPHIWGWATWANSWAQYQEDSEGWEQYKTTECWRKWMPDPIERQYWESIFDLTFKDEINSWGYRWTAAIWKHRGLTVTPNVNLVSNIGFGEGGTHTHSSGGEDDSLPVEDLGKILFIEYIERNIQADNYVFHHHYQGKYMHGLGRIARILSTMRKKLVKLF